MAIVVVGILNVSVRWNCSLVIGCKNDGIVSFVRAPIRLNRVRIKRCHLVNHCVWEVLADEIRHQRIDYRTTAVTDEMQRKLEDACAQTKRGIGQARKQVVRCGLNPTFFCIIRVPDPVVHQHDLIVRAVRIWPGIKVSSIFVQF